MITLIAIRLKVIGALEKFISIIEAQKYCIISTVVIFLVFQNRTSPVNLFC